MSQGNQTNPSALNNVNLVPVFTLTGTSVNYAQQIGKAWVQGYQATGRVFARSNATTSMTDSLPNPALNFGDQGALPNGWNFYIFNNDASASITLTPVGCTINGASDLVITAGTRVWIVTDSVNYFSK